MRILSLPCLIGGLCLLALAPGEVTAQGTTPETITIDAREGRYHHDDGRNPYFGS